MKVRTKLSPHEEKKAKTPDVARFILGSRHALAPFRKFNYYGPRLPNFPQLSKQTKTLFFDAFQLTYFLANSTSLKKTWVLWRENWDVDRQTLQFCWQSWHFGHQKWHSKNHVLWPLGKGFPISMYELETFEYNSWNADCHF